MSTERSDRLLLSLIVEPGDPRVADLIARVGASASLEMIRTSLRADGIGGDAGQRLREARPEAVLERGERIGARFVIPGDAEWPESVDDLAHAGHLSGRGGVPIGLWVRGQRLDSLTPRVAIVGSRAATTYGVEAAALIASECARAGQVVVSGGAFGIDIAAHRGTLAVGGRTIVALAHGLDRVYPAANTRVVESAMDTGALVSELAPGAAPMQLRFLSRNRLIAALAAGTLVVEAGVRSGALNTANWAGRLSRPVLAMPGPTTSAASRGPHELIRSGAAVLATSGADVLELLAPAGEALLSPARAPERPRDRLDLRSRQLLDAVPAARPSEIARIAAVAGIAEPDARDLIRSLEERALVVYEAGGWRVADLDRGPADGDSPTLEG